ncbi:1-hydroxycarotenoid 3,4-desaturase [Handroanthus impetiginosus]|uniref:1-hydroxycarotenoid 3,4-desaturase n=1 Tax=Handroanthus impetiginosus TaxID=429701 RepID=A0A2G9HAH6_9LAMI|nr:1-hydroxycarotenoid 3,4-desaturase [Handroanthus impetiginosus]
MSKVRDAVVGGGISGLMSAYVLAKEGMEVVLYEKEDYLGSHANTVMVDGTQLDIGFIIFNRREISHWECLFSLWETLDLLMFRKKKKGIKDLMIELLEITLNLTFGLIN